MALKEKREGSANVEPASEDTSLSRASSGGYLARDDDGEVFKSHVGKGETDYRTVGWVKAAFLMLKVIFSIGVLSIPSMIGILGAAPGAILTVAWTLTNTYCAFVQGDFKVRHPHCHTIADMAGVVGGSILREITGILYVIGFMMVGANGILGCAISINALSDHADCTLIWSAISTVFCIAVACLPKFATIGILTWIGCILIVLSVVLITIATSPSLRDRPYAAPQTGPYTLGFEAVRHPNFISGQTANNVLFVSSSGTSSFIPVLAEMRCPQDYKKSITLGMSFTTLAYLIFGLLIYRFCGDWLTSPSLGSAGPVWQKICYGIAFPSLLITTILVLHLCSKYVFVRALRGTRHLQEKTLLHYGVWFGSTVVLGIISWVVASSVPFFSSLLGLIGSICFGPVALILPAVLWLYTYSDYRRGTLLQKLAYAANVGLFLLGWYITGPGTYAAVMGIIQSYQTGSVGSAFSCADTA